MFGCGGDFKSNPPVGCARFASDCEHFEQLPEAYQMAQLLAMSFS